MFWVHHRSDCTPVRRSTYRANIALSASSFAVLMLAAPNAAQGQSIEVWTGAEAFRHAWSVYAGVTLAPGTSIQEEGLRLRLVAGQSQYRVQAAAGTGRGISPFADALVGYQFQQSSVTIKAFAGVSGVANLESQQDLAAFWDRTLFGPKVAIETWWTISDSAWASLDLSWSQPHQSYYGRLRAAWRPTPQVSLGLESGLLGHATGSSLRAGPFVRYEWGGGEISLSGGVVTDGALGWPGAAPIDREVGGYATLNWLQRF